MVLQFVGPYTMKDDIRSKKKKKRRSREKSPYQMVYLIKKVWPEILYTVAIKQIWPATVQTERK